MTTLYVIGFIIAFLLILGSGIPVGFGLGVLALGIMTAYADFDTALGLCIDQAYASLDTDVLVAIPLFVLAAQLISATGMGKRLFDAAKACMGGFRSGLGAATIASSGVFSAMTGSSFVSASTMGLIAIPELRRAKYTDTLISAAIAAGGSLGSVIPPSLVMIIYGYLTDESIGKLFMAGIIPGVLLMVLYSAALAILTGKKPSAAAERGTDTSVTDNEEEADEDATMPIGKALKESVWGLMAPIIILGGIYLGIFTANEAAAVAVLYCIIVGLWIYRTLTYKSLWQVISSATAITGMVALVVIGGSMLAQAAVYGRVPQQILELIIAKELSSGLLLFLVIVILFVLGMFMESVSLMYLAIPLLHPVVVHMGWDNIWFAVILLINVNLGLITPPMGGVLYIISQIGAIPFETVVKGAIMPIIVLLLVMVMMIIYPPIATWLPSLM